MKNKCLLLFLCCVLGAGTLLAQKVYELPRNIKLESKTDYAGYRQEVVHAANWLEVTALDSDLPKRREINAFIIQWASGTDDVTVEISEEVSRLYGVNVDLLGIYIAAYCRYYIQHEHADKFHAAKSAVMTMVDVYKKGITIEKVAKMDAFISMNEADQDRYIREHILPQY